MSSNRWRIIALLMGYAAFGHFNRVGITVAGAELFIPKYGISESDMGWVYTALLIAYTLAMLPGGWLIDRIGSGRALAIFGVTMGTFAMLTGVAGWYTESPYTLLICLLVVRSLAGLCNAPLHPGAAHVVSGEMAPNRRATANGMVTAGAVVGISCCYPVFGWLMDTLGWQWAFIVGGSALVAYGLLWWLIAVPVLPQPQTPTEQPVPSPETRSVPSAWSTLGDTTLWLLTFSYAGYGYFQYLFFYWMNYYFTKVLKVSNEDSRWATFWVVLAMGAGMAIGGRCTDVLCNWLGTINGRRAIVITGMGLGAVFGILGVNVTEMGLGEVFETLGVNVPDLVYVALCLAIAMAAVGMCEGVFWTTATDIGGKSGGRSGGLAGAFMNTGGNIGGLIAPILTPFLAKEIGWTGAIAVACIISGIGGLTWLLIRPPVAD
ncbi:MAG: MFS transporter [Planctomycetota bacterium]|nr:MFS transporter [Planctomycetota bacterium]